MSTMVQDQLFSVAPERSLKQRLDALAHANEIRFARAQMKRDIKAGRLAAEGVLLEPPAHAESMKVLDLLLSMPKVGRVKANKTVTKCSVSPSKTLGGMTQRQRVELASWLRSR